MAKYVYSTLTDDMEYAVYSKQAKDKNSIVEKVIRINGGANRVNKTTLLTPRGAVTEVTDADAKLLESNTVFKIHKENGYVSIDSKKTEADNAAKNLTKKDRASQKTKEDYEESIKNRGEKKLKVVEEE